MTLGVATGLGPKSNIGIAPIAGSGARSIIANTILEITQTIITNYVNSKIDEAFQKVGNKVSGTRKAQRYSHKRSRTRYSRNRFSQNARYRKWVKRPRRLKRQYSG